MFKFKIEKAKTLYCRVIKVERKRRIKDEKMFVIVYFGHYDSGEFIRTLIREEIIDDSFYDDMQRYKESRKKWSIEKVLVCPNVSVYHRISWDDVHKGKCSIRNLYEIERDEEGMPIVYDKIVMFIDPNENTEIEYNKIKYEVIIKPRRERDISNILAKEYIAIDALNVKDALKYKNSYTGKPWQEDSDEDNYFYDNYFCEEYDDVDLSPENRVMDALENGMGELFGLG